jgi:hypothetical protein
MGAPLIQSSYRVAACSVFTRVFEEAVMSKGQPGDGKHGNRLLGAIEAASLARIVPQTVACNALHSTEERMCRWLLMMHDRAEGKALPYTHEILSHMLGAGRKSVTLAAQSLQTAGLISYRRGKILVVDRAPASNRPRASATHRQGAV